jgi:Flp pilus assembly protein TadG
VDAAKLTMRTRPHFVSDETGASAAEFALAFIPFSALVFGIIALSMVLYANQTLQSATEAAARYYSVTTANNNGTEPSGSAVSTYGEQQFTGPMAATFTPSRGGCGPNGFQVYGTGTIPINAGVYSTTLTLQAHACFP